MTTTELILLTELGDFVNELEGIEGYVGIAENFGGCE